MRSFFRPFLFLLETGQHKQLHGLQSTSIPCLPINFAVPSDIPLVYGGNRWQGCIFYRASLFLGLENADVEYLEFDGVVTVPP